MIKLQLLVMALAVASFTDAQTDPSIIIRGVVREAETKAPIPFASIAISNTTRGTAANENGEFMLKILRDERDHDLKVSSIGYLTRRYKISDFTSETIVIELKSDVKLLSEIVVAENAIKSIDLINSAIDSINVNYRVDPFNLEFYSTLIAHNTLTGKQFKLETLVLGYCKGYGTEQVKKFKILKKRTEGDNPLEAANYPFWPTWELHQADVISDPMKTGVLNKDNLDKFEFTYGGVSIYEADTVYKIDYRAPKPTKRITGYGTVPKVYKGTIYITTTSNAIVKHDIETDQFQHSIIYRKLGEHYFPYLISGQRTTKSNMFAKVKNSLILINVRLNDVEVIQKSNEFDNAADLPEDDEFWEMNYPID